MDTMKYSVIKVINGNYFIHSEGFTDIASAKVSYHNLCASLWNEASVAYACVMIADQNLIAVDGYREIIEHIAE